MKLVIDNDICKQNDLTLEEFLILYIHAKNIKINDIINNIVNKGIAGKNLFETNNIVLSSKTRQLVEQIILDSNKTVQENTERIKNLAKTLQEIYISGKKAGTSDYFRGSSADIIQKLKRFFIEYGEFSDEQIINATKKYVESFNGDYRYAQLLKYFISKKVDGEKGSRLLSYIENENQEDPNQLSIDWSAELK